MSNEPRELVLLSRAQKALAEAQTLDEVKELRDKAVAVRAYVQKARIGQNLVVEAATIKLRAERRLGEMLQATELAKGSPGNQHTGSIDGNESPNGALTLRDLGISKSDSSRTQRIAAFSADDFERFIAESVAAGREPTASALMRSAKPAAPATVTPATGSIESNDEAWLQPITGMSGQFSTGFVELPWSSLTENESAEASSMSVDDVCRLPMARAFQDQAHLHVWCEPDWLFAGLDILESWEFRYRDCLACLYPTTRQGSYWQSAHALLLLGVRGDLAFQSFDCPSWFQFDSPEDFDSKDAVLELIEQVSPGPYLGVFGPRQSDRPDWTICSPEI